MPIRKPLLLGERFGKLTVLNLLGKTDGRNYWAEFVCDCGRTTVAVERAVRYGKPRSCGCLHIAALANNRLTHGHTRRKSPSKEYVVWQHIMRRCYTKTNPAYRYYGGRGISVCKRWHDFSNFVSDMGVKPDGLSIDRIDNNGNYEPSNCRWATQKEQVQNSRSAKLTSHLVAEIRASSEPSKILASKYGVNPDTITSIRAFRSWT